MDPNEALRRIRALAAEADKLSPYLEVDQERAVGLADELATAARDLDEWMTAGNYPPAAWDVPRQQAIMIVEPIGAVVATEVLTVAILAAIEAAPSRHGFLDVTYADLARRIAEAVVLRVLQDRQALERHAQQAAVTSLLKQWSELEDRQGRGFPQGFKRPRDGA